MVIHPKPDRVYGPEPWKTVNCETFLHWDLWFLVVMAELPHGKWEFVQILKRKAEQEFGANRRDVEAKLSHLIDLETRLLSAGLTHDVLLADVTINYRLRRRANEKVMQQHVGGYPSPAMVNTPRNRLSERAMRGHWNRFPVSPKEHEASFGHQFTRPDGYYDYRTTPVMMRLLHAKWQFQRTLARSPAEKVAVDRLVLTVIVGLMDHIDDDDDAAPVFNDVLGAYLRDVWTAGADPAVVLRDGIEFALWEDYGLANDGTAFLAAIPREHHDDADRILAETRAELVLNGLEREHGCLMGMWVDFAVAHERFGDFMWLAQRLEGEGWNHSASVAQMVTAAEEAGREDVAGAVLDAIPPAKVSTR